MLRLANDGRLELKSTGARYCSHSLAAMFKDSKPEQPSSLTHAWTDVTTHHLATSRAQELHSIETHATLNTFPGRPSLPITTPLATCPYT